MRQLRQTRTDVERHEPRRDDARITREPDPRDGSLDREAAHRMLRLALGPKGARTTTVAADAWTRDGDRVTFTPERSIDNDG